MIEVIDKLIVVAFSVAMFYMAYIMIVQIWRMEKFNIEFGKITKKHAKTTKEFIYCQHMGLYETTEFITTRYEAPF